MTCFSKISKPAGRTKENKLVSGNCWLLYFDGRLDSMLIFAVLALKVVQKKTFIT